MYTFSTSSSFQSTSVGTRDVRRDSQDQSISASPLPGNVKFEGPSDSVPLALATKREKKIDDGLLEPIRTEVDSRISSSHISSGSISSGSTLSTGVSSSSLAAMSRRPEDAGRMVLTERRRGVPADVDRKADADHKAKSRVPGAGQDASAIEVLAVRTALRQQQEALKHEYEQWKVLRLEADVEFIEKTQRAIAVVNNYMLLPVLTDASTQRLNATRSIDEANANAEAASKLSDSIQIKMEAIADSLQAVNRALAILN